MTLDEQIAALAQQPQCSDLTQTANLIQIHRRCLHILWRQITNLGGWDRAPMDKVYEYTERQTQVATMKARYVSQAARLGLAEPWDHIVPDEVDDVRPK